MPTFPAIAPASRTFTPGDYPHSPFVALSGEQSRVRHSDAVLGASLELEFVRLTEAERLSIETHYLGQYGEMDPFPLPAQTFSGFNPNDFNQGAGFWRYAEPPEIEDFCGPTHDVRVRLVSVLGGVAGAQLGTITASIVGADAYASANGMTASITTSLVAGAATATTPVGPLLLLHMEGTGTTIVDSSSVPKTITLGSGSTQDITQSTTQFKYGSKSLSFPSGWSWMQAATFAVTGGSVGSTVGAVTIELWFWLSSAAGSASLTHIFSSNNSALSAYYQSSGGLSIGAGAGGGSIGALATQTWHYIKITRATNGVLRRFLNGTEYYTSTTYSNYGSLTSFRLGSSAADESPISMSGYIDEVRIRPEVDNSLTVPTAAFPDP